MKTNDIIQAMTERRSIRDFKGDAVPRELLEPIIHTTGSTKNG